ncbi:hypothetical protein EDB92DRAFT_1952743 [Lactarius akahatsu]|uniref:Methyltransferase n=1 Tax=Lactarius akahatsu TaxID=416441 RepID=A0AAD4L803_9AGAM|nr:hypothetical protein EDB92DRAFT_1952743 [Lactarius akahatsu]
MTDSSEPRFVDTTLRYFTAPTDGSKAWSNINADPTTGERASNWEYTAHAVKIENLRLRGRAEVTLDKNGFQFFHHPAKHTSFANDEEILREYYPESIELLKQLTGASRVVLFDHTIRRRRPGVVDTPQARQPVPGVHVDQTTASAIARVQRHLPPEDVEGLLQRRFQIINLVDRSRDLVPHTLKYPDRDGETYGVQWNENHRWKYVRGLTPEEGVLIKCFDSIQDGSVAVLTPHTAFEDPTTPSGVEKRESIELRALVFYD